MVVQLIQLWNILAVFQLPTLLHTLAGLAGVSLPVLPVTFLIAYCNGEQHCPTLRLTGVQQHPGQGILSLSVHMKPPIVEYALSPLVPSSCNHSPTKLTFQNHRNSRYGKNSKFCLHLLRSNPSNATLHPGVQKIFLCPAPKYFIT